MVGAIARTIFHFLEDLPAIVSMLLEWKSVMNVIGLVALVEGILLVAGSPIAALF